MTTSYVYDVHRSLPVVLDDGTRKYVWGLGLAYAVDTAGNVQVYHTDGLGSVRAITDASGTVVQTYQTDEFGVPTQSQGSVNQPFQYTGEQRDAESGFYYLRARYYDPGLGRFLTRDRFSGAVPVPTSLHRYSYVRHNPVNLADHSGRFAPLVLVIGGSVITVGPEVIAAAVITTGATAVASNYIRQHPEQVQACADSIAAAVASLGSPAAEYRVIDTRTGEVIVDTSNPPTYKATTGTPSSFPEPKLDPERGPDWDPNWSPLKKVWWILDKLARVRDNIGGPVAIIPIQTDDGAPLALPGEPGRK